MALLFWKWQYWKSGIPAYKFRKEQMRDIHDIISIDNAINEKGLREQEINKMKGGITW